MAVAPIVMSKQSLNRALLARQMLLSREAVSPLAAVERLIALQAQQARPPFVGLWTRVAGLKREALLQLIRDRKIVRATMMRATLHLLSAKDYLQFRTSMQSALSAARQSILKSRKSEVDVDAILAAAEGCFVERPQTFGELRATLSARFPDVDERAMGYVARTCLPLVMQPEDSEYGFGGDGKFAMAASILKKRVDKEDHVEDLMLRYLAAFGPATVADAQAWSGLPKLKPVFEALRPKLTIFRDGAKRELFDVAEAPRPSEDVPAPVRFLPGFDNAILAHVDRSRIIAEEHRPRVATKNLQILPTFLCDGYVAGTWEFAAIKKTATLNLSAFKPLAKAAKQDLSDEAEQLIRFIAPDASSAEVLFKTA